MLKSLSQHERQILLDKFGHEKSKERKFEFKPKISLVSELIVRDNSMYVNMSVEERLQIKDRCKRDKLTRMQKRKLTAVDPECTFEPVIRV